MNAPEWYASQRYSRTLPLRRVVETWTYVSEVGGEVYAEPWERLECGHEDMARGFTKAARRRCWQCGPAGTARFDTEAPFGGHTYGRLFRLRPPLRRPLLPRL